MEFIIKVITFLLVAIGMAVISALPVWWLWNWLMPTIFDLPRIGFSQALGLCMLTNILFKNSSSTKKN